MTHLVLPLCSGGYLNESNWEKDGWSWRCFRNVKWPTFWISTGPSGLHQYRLRTVFQEVDMPWSWPVNVNYHEAKAFANWKSDQAGVPRDTGYRILSEPEHHRIRDESATNDALGTQRDPSMVADGHAMASAHRANSNLAFGSESPVDGMTPSR